MKIKLTYSDVKQALKAGFASPLNSKVLTPIMTLVRSLSSFRNADKPRAAAAHIDQLIQDSGVIAIHKKSPKMRDSQNVFINYVIRELNARSNNKFDSLQTALRG